MPNWCDNSIELQHDNPSMIAKAAQALKDGRFFSEFAPCPQDLLDTVSGFHGKGTPEQIALEKQQQENIKTHGFSDWYSWNNANWGTKWEACEPKVTQHSDNFITASFNTAWGPPLPFYDKLKDLGFTIKGYYYEPGMAFCGLWDDGEDDYYSIEGNSEWVMDNIPSDIDFIFCISECIADWEEQEREEAQ